MASAIATLLRRGDRVLVQPRGGSGLRRGDRVLVQPRGGSGQPCGSDSRGNWRLSETESV